MSISTFPDFLPLVNPQSVAVIGASPDHDKIAGRIGLNLLKGNFDGELFLVNPKYDEIDGGPCYSCIGDVPRPVDTAVVIIPAQAALVETRAAAAAGCKFAIIMSSGFAEMGAEGAAAEAELKQIADESGMRIYGPNCPGLFVISERRAYSFSPRLEMELWARGGRTALVTQGGAMGRAIIDAMEVHGSPRLNYWFSCGNEADLQVSEFLGWLADEPTTDTVLMVVESFRDGARFMEAAARARDNGTQVVVLKVGTSEAGRRAAATHTAALSTSDDIVNAAFKQCGVIRANDIDELIDVARILDRYGVKKVANVGVCSLSGGSAAHIADLCGVHELGVGPPTPETVGKMRDLLPPLAAVGNPVDLTTQIYNRLDLVGDALEVFLGDVDIDGIVMSFPCQLGRINHLMAGALADVSRRSDKPIVAVAVSESVMEDETASTLRKAYVPLVPSATKAVLALKRYSTIASSDQAAAWSPASRSGSTSIPGTGALSEEASEAVLASQGIPFAVSEIADGEQQSLAVAERIGYPVVIKAAGEGILHKSDAGLVRVGIKTPEEVAVAYREICESHSGLIGEPRTSVKIVEMVSDGVELICGINVDETFGAVVSCGLGGIYAELLADVAMRVCPIDVDQAKVMISETKAGEMLGGIRGSEPLDIVAAAAVVAALSRFGYENSAQLAGVDLNPIKVRKNGAVALDALVILAADR